MEPALKNKKDKKEKKHQKERPSYDPRADLGLDKKSKKEKHVVDNNRKVKYVSADCDDYDSKALFQNFAKKASKKIGAMKMNN